MMKWLKSLFARKKVTIDSLVKACKGNLASLSWEIGKAVLYVKDKKFSTAQEALDAGVGDCDEFAKIWAKCLWKMGYNAKIYNCFGKKGNHAIVVFIKDGYWCYTSNDEYIKTNVTGAVEGFLEFAYPAERYEIVV